MTTGTPVEDTNALKNDILSLLRQNTQPLHHALEQTAMSQLLLSPKLDRSTYVRILYGFYGAFSSLEKMVEEMANLYKMDELEGLLDSRAAQAMEDIRYLTGTFDASLLPGSSLPFAARSVPEALGVVYVMEGSKLGGKVISKHLSQTIGVSPAEGGRFFANTEGSGMEGWKLFKLRCSAHADNHPDHTKAIIGSANSTFGYLHDYFVHYYSANA